MAIVTCKAFTYAPYTSGGTESTITYGTGVMLEDYLAKVDITVDRTDEKEYADGHLIDSEKIPTAAHMVMELVNNNDAIKTDILGMVSSGSSSSAELLMTEADPPFVGAGCLVANRYKGTVTWEGYWMYKIQFAHNGISAETRRDRTSWQHDTINGDAVGVTLSSGGAVTYFAHKSGMTEAAAIAWLKGHAGIQTT